MQIKYFPIEQALWLNVALTLQRYHTETAVKHKFLSSANVLTEYGKEFNIDKKGIGILCGLYKNA